MLSDSLVKKRESLVSLGVTDANISVILQSHASGMIRFVWTALFLLLISINALQNSASTVKVITQQTASTVLHTSLLSAISQQDHSGTDNAASSEMKILQLNVRSLNTSKALLERYVDRNDISLITLTETWNKDNDKLSFKNWNTRSLFKNRRPDRYIPPTSKKRKQDTENPSTPQDEELEDGGGSAILAAPHVKIVHRTDMDIHRDLEIVWAQVYAEL